MPRFQKQFSKKAERYFHSASDQNFRRKHPLRYRLIVACGCIGLLLPLCLLILFTTILFPVPNSGFLMLALAGSFIIGVGIFNIVSAFICQYLGHIVTVGAFLLGGTMTATSLVILYHPSIYALFDETLVSYYFVSLHLLLVLLLFYPWVRIGIHTMLRRKRIGKSTIKSLKKGKRNFWWYEALHKEYNLGFLYHLNKWTTILYPITVLLSILFAWVKVVTPLISVLYAIIALVMAVMAFFASMQENIENYGKPIVLFRRSSTKKIDSIFFDLGIPAFLLASAYVHMHMLSMLDVFVKSL